MTIPFMGGDGWDSTELDTTALAGSFYSNHFSPEDTRPVVTTFVSAYHTRYGSDPDAIAALSYDSTNQLLNAIQHAGVDDPNVVKDHLADLLFAGVTGDIAFNVHHNPNKSAVIIQVNGGKFNYFANSGTVKYAISGSVTRPNGEPWAGFPLPYLVRGDIPENYKTSVTDSDGRFEFEVDPESYLLLVPSQSPDTPDGYQFSPQDMKIDDDGGVQQNHGGLLFRSSGIRNSSGHIGGPPGPCKSNAKVTYSAPDASTIEVYTNAEGNFNVNGLEPVTYTVTPSRSGCADGEHSVYQPAFHEADARPGNSDNLNFEIPRVRLLGRAHLAPPKDQEALATGLVASFRPNNDSMDYTASINWIDGFYQIEDIPANLGGKLTISRVGGAAAFGYVSSTNAPSASPPTTACTGCYTVNIDAPMLEGDTGQDVTLTGARMASGTIAGNVEYQPASNTPVLKDATVQFANDLNWVQTWRPGLTVNGKSDGTAYLINNAQPRLYYLAPVMDGIRTVSPTRSLANLTAAASATANFTLTWQTRWLCLRTNDIRTQYGEPPVFQNFSGASSPIRIKAAVGTTPYYYFTHDSCGTDDAWTMNTIPYGMFGNLEVSNHTLTSSSTVEPLTWEGRSDFYLNLQGDRTVTGKLIAIAHPWVKFDQPRMEDQVKLSYMEQGSVPENYISDNFTPYRYYNDSTREFSYANLERNKYQIKLTGSIQGYTFSPLVTTVAGTTDTVLADLTAGDRDLGTLFKATHIDINPASMSAVDHRPQLVTFTWNRPSDYNESDPPNAYQVQVGDASATFTDTFPAPIQRVGRDDTNKILDTITFDWVPSEYSSTPLNKNLKWRVRAVFYNDYGQWMPTQNLGLAFNQVGGMNNTYASDGLHLGWSAYPLAAYYGYQIGTTNDFSTLKKDENTTNMVTDPISGLTSQTIYYWRVAALDGTYHGISFWSNTALLYYGWNKPASADVSKLGTNLIFTVADSNSTYPDNARYQVNFALASGAFSDTMTSSNSWISNTPPPNGATWTQPLGTIANGTYKWRVRLVAGTVPMTDWYIPSGLEHATFTK